MILDMRPKDVFISLENIDENFILTESIDITTHKPVFIVLTQGNSIVSKGISAVTHSKYTHASISFDPQFKQIFSFNMNTNGLIVESMQTFKDNIVSVFAFFTHNEVCDKLKQRVDDFRAHKTHYDTDIIIRKLFNIDKAKATIDEYSQVCSTFVNNIVRLGNIDLSNGRSLPAPSDIYASVKTKPNTIFELYTGKASQFDYKESSRKLRYIVRRKYTTST